MFAVSNFINLLHKLLESGVDEFLCVAKCQLGERGMSEEEEK